MVVYDDFHTLLIPVPLTSLITGTLMELKAITEVRTFYNYKLLTCFLFSSTLNFLSNYHISKTAWYLFVALFNSSHQFQL